MKIFSPENAVHNAKKLFFERYKGAQFCIAAGSIVRGKGTIYSDLDLIVVFSRLDHAYRESFIFQDMPVEAFVHDYETIQSFIDEDYNDAHASIMDMIEGGIVVPGPTETSDRLQKYAAELLKRGPQTLAHEKEQALRYFISDLLDDLKGDRPAEEQRAILYKLYPQIGELALRHAGKFVSTGKHLARNLKEFCPDILEVLEDVMRHVHDDALNLGHIKRLEDIIEIRGGLVFDGYSRDAPKEKRSRPRWLG